MERLAELISKLKEQFDNGADSSKLLATTLLIERELMRQESQAVTITRSKVAVVMPGVRTGLHEELPARPQVGKQEEATKVGNETTFDPIIEIPTLAQQHSTQEINERLAIRDASLNDKLKENKVEVGHLLKDHPIRDLKKAIGVNDRFVFINELFRGDEVMYERSLKTINAFRIYAEAEYWIERELKVKLGWLEDNEAVRHFYQLVKRRFA